MVEAIITRQGRLALAGWAGAGLACLHGERHLALAERAEREARVFHGALREVRADVGQGEDVLE